MKLKISETLSLPIEAITNTFAIFGIRGAGKSNLGAVMAEGIIKAGQPVCIIDPTGAWYGLKSSADGKSPGLPVYVFGGEHADIPLEPTAGEVLANFMVENRLPVVLDLKLMRKHEQIKFVMTFAEVLFHRNREPLMVFIDEAARFAPQNIKDRMPEAARCLGAVEDLATLGRNRGLGVTLMAQRPAPVSTTLRTQVENLICLRTVGKHDRKAIDEWVEAKGTQQERDRMMKDLAELPDGVGYFWSPGWLRKFQKEHFLRRETFDSGATPKVGAKPIVPRAFAEVDKNRLSAEIQATIERAKSEDPKELRKRILELERAKAVPAAATPKAADPDALKREFDRGALSVKKVLAKEVARYSAAMEKLLSRYTTSFNAARERLDATADELAKLEKPTIPALESLIAEVQAVRMDPVRQSPAARPVVPRAPMPRPERAPRANSQTNGSIPLGERKILIACAQYPDGAARDQLTVLTSYKRSTRDAYIQRLGERGYVEMGGAGVLATQEGIDALGSDYEPLPVGEELQQYWFDRLPAGECAILRVLVEAGQNPVSREALEETTGFKRSTRDAYIQRLSSRRLVEVNGPGTVRASAALFS